MSADWLLQTLADLFVGVHPLIYEVRTRDFHWYNSQTGAWARQSDAQLRHPVAQFLSSIIKGQFDYGTRVAERGALNGIFQQEKLPRHMHPNSKGLQTVIIDRLKDRYSGDVPRPIPGRVLLLNGVLDLNERPPKLLPHSPEHGLRHGFRVTWDPSATCPTFLQLLGARLDQQDISLLQRYAGSLLLEINKANAILFMLGVSDTKLALLNIIKSMIGGSRVAQLGPDHLRNWDDVAYLHEERLLIGQTLESNLLFQEGVHHLNALVGGDYLEAEMKPELVRQGRVKDCHIIIHDKHLEPVPWNPNLESWRQRILIVRFTKPAPKVMKWSAARGLLQQERSGILNWMVEGAILHKEELAAGGGFKLSPEQEARVDALIGKPPQPNQTATLIQEEATNPQTVEDPQTTHPGRPL